MISSASTKFANTGPSSTSKLSLVGRYTRVPTMSEGTRSLVNWTRTNDPPTTVASVCTASVFATPGTPSSRQWPRASNATSIRSTMWSWPTMTFFTSNPTRSSSAASLVVSGTESLATATGAGAGADCGGGGGACTWVVVSPGGSGARVAVGSGGSCTGGSGSCTGGAGSGGSGSRGGSAPASSLGAGLLCRSSRAVRSSMTPVFQQRGNTERGKPRPFGS